MDSQLRKTHDAHGHHYDEHDALTQATGHDHNEDEHPEKKSMMQKVKEKAKRLKNKITGHGHDHDDEDDEDDDDDDDNETVEDPDVHGAPMYDSAKVGQLGGPDAILSHQRHNLEKPSVKNEDRSTVTKPLSSHGPTPPVSTGAYGANLSEPSGIGHGPTPPVSTGASGANLSEPSGIGHGLGLGHHQTSGHEVHPDKWTSKVGQPTGVEEDPFTPNPARVNNTPINVTGPTHGMKHVSSGHQGHDAHKGELKSDLGMSTGHQGHDAHKGELKSDLGKSTAIPDSRAPKDPSSLDSHPLNYESKVTDPTHTGDKEVDMSKRDPSRLGSHPLNYESKVTDPTHTGDKGVDMSKNDPSRLGSHPLNYDSKVADPTHTGGKEVDMSKKDPSRLGSHPLNYESKVADPTHTGGKEVDMSKTDPSRLGSHPLNYESKVAHPTHTGGKEVDMLKKDPSRLGSHPLNHESKVADPTHTGGKEVDLSKIQHPFENLEIGSNPKSYDPNHPENLPHDTLSGNQSSKTSSNTEKISSSDSATADNAAAAKDVLASKLGDSGQNQPTGSHKTDTNTGSMMDYAYVITDKVTGTLAPVYGSVVDAGSTVISKVQGTVPGSESGTGTVPPQVHHGGSGAVAMDEGKETDKGVSVKEYVAETTRPGDEDKALSDVISHALHRGDEEESEKKSEQDKPMGIVTESVEVRRRLGTDPHEEHQQQQNSGDASADKNMGERLRDAVGSWFGGKGDAPEGTPAPAAGSWFGGKADAPQGTLETSNVTDQGLSSNPRGDQKS